MGEKTKEDRRQQDKKKLGMDEVRWYCREAKNVSTNDIGSRKEQN